MPASISQLSYIQNANQFLSKGVIFYISHIPLKLSSFTFFLFLLLWAFLGASTDKFLQENISAHMITEHLKMKLIERNVSERRKQRRKFSWENFHKKVCLFCFLWEMNNFTFLLLSSAVTKEFLFHQLPSLANQGNKDHFYVSGFQRLCHTYW